MTGPLGYYRELLQLEPHDFAVAVLDFDPFVLLEGRDAFNLALAMLTRLLKRAQDQLGGCHQETDGWDDLDLGNEASPKQDKLLERLSCQLRRLQVLDAMGEETFKECSKVHDLGWSQFRDLEVDVLFKLATLLAAKGEISALQALMKEDELKKKWPLILEALPETLELEAVKALLPIKGLGSWCVDRAMKVVKRTGLCRLALELLEHAICELQGLAVDRKGPPRTEHLPELQAGSEELREVYCMFCLCQEYDEYLYKSHQEMLDSGWPAEQPPAIQSLVRFPDFCQLPAAQRLSLLLKYSGQGTVVADLKTWLGISVRCEDGSLVAGEFANGVATLALKSEEALVKALLSRSGGWDPEDFKFLAQVALASSPALPRSERILKDHVLLMRFIFESIYSEDQRCRAVDIFESVDAMYGCIPKADSDATGDSSLWHEFQRQADELEKHLTCVELLLKHKIKLSVSFADLRSACRNESRAVHFVWNLFRVLGAHYRQALFWRSFQQELFYLHQYAFAAMPMNSVYEMYVRCLVDQDHAEVLNSVVEAWISSSDEALGSLLALAYELVNRSPSLHHVSLEKATRLLKCADSPGAATELDFVRSCELLHDLLVRKPKRDWIQSAMQNAGQVAQLSEMTKHIVAGQSRDRESLAVDSFCMDTPLQLRLRLQEPLQIIRELFEFNPAILLEEELPKFCKLIHLEPEKWSDVMMLCSSAHLVCGDRREALHITEQLVAKGHPKAWKLAVALVEEPHLLADAVKVCPEDDLLQLMEYLEDEPLAESHFEGLPMDLDLTLEEAWSLDVEAAASTLVSLAEPSDFSVAYNFDEDPEMHGISGPLQGLCEAYPDLILDEGLEAQLMSLVSRGDALSLARAVAGVPELVEQGITASSIAFQAAKSFEQELAPLIFLLNEADAVRLLELALEGSRAMALEVVALLRCREDLALTELLRQAEAVVLLKSLGPMPLEISTSLAMEEMKARWLAQIDEEHLPLAQALLDTGF